MTQKRMVFTPRRQRQWFVAQVNVEGLGALGQNGLAIDAGINLNDRKGMTIVRIIGDLAFASSVAGGQGRLGAGIGFVNDDAATASAFPDPNRNDVLDTDWLWSVQNVFHEWNTGTGQVFHHINFDVRAKRKWRTRGDGLFLVTNNNDATNALNIKGYLKYLVLLP